jgi:hypothetical protein
MSEKYNHKCAICGNENYFCADCNNAKTFTPWRTIVDSIEHYKIFLIINDLTNKHIDIDTAKKMLNERDLSDLDNFVPEIKKVINDIMSYENIVSSNKRKKK